LIVLVTTPSDPLPADLAAAHAMILAQREQLTLAKSEVTVGRLEIERLKLMLAKARREQFGQSSERGKLLGRDTFVISDGQMTCSRSGFCQTPRDRRDQRSDTRHARHAECRPSHAM